METTLDPTDLGWVLENDYMLPVMTDMDLVPCEVLNVICCNCNVGMKNHCGDKQCLCRSSGLKCVAVCRNCRGTKSQNFIPITNCKDDERNIL